MFWKYEGGCSIVPPGNFLLLNTALKILEYEVVNFFFLTLKLLRLLFIYLFRLHRVFVAVRRLFSSCGEWGLLFIGVRGLLIAVASLLVEHGL